MCYILMLIFQGFVWVFVASPTHVIYIAQWYLLVPSCQQFGKTEKSTPIVSGPVFSWWHKELCLLDNFACFLSSSVFFIKIDFFEKKKIQECQDQVSPFVWPDQGQNYLQRVNESDGILS